MNSDNSCIRSRPYEKSRNGRTRAMYYCETSNRTIPYRPWFFRRNKCSVRRRKEPVWAFLKAMVAPETTTPPMARGTWENSWFGAVKTLFWIANALVIGIIMAKVC